MRSIGGAQRPRSRHCWKWTMLAASPSLWSTRGQAAALHAVASAPHDWCRAYDWSEHGELRHVHVLPPLKGRTAGGRRPAPPVGACRGPWRRQPPVAAGGAAHPRRTGASTPDPGKILAVNSRHRWPSQPLMFTAFEADFTTYIDDASISCKCCRAWAWRTAAPLHVGPPMHVAPPHPGLRPSEWCPGAR